MADIKPAKGGAAAKSITPYGYCGNLPDIELKSAAEYTERTVKIIPDMITKYNTLK